MSRFCRECIHMRLVSAGDKEPHPVVMFCKIIRHHDGSHLDCYSARESGVCGPAGDEFIRGTPELDSE